MLLFVLRLIALAVWAALFVYMVPGARAAIKGKDLRRGDPMRLGVAIICLVMILGNLRWLLAPESDELFAAVYVLSIIAGAHTFKLAMVYGRGPLL